MWAVLTEPALEEWGGEGGGGAGVVGVEVPH
jgi:hypothetical protein